MNFPAERASKLPSIIYNNSNFTLRLSQRASIKHTHTQHHNHKTFTPHQNSPTYIRTTQQTPLSHEKLESSKRKDNLLSTHNSPVLALSQLAGSNRATRIRWRRSSPWTPLYTSPPIYIYPPCQLILRSSSSVYI